MTIREKAKFNAITLPNGEIRLPYCKCRVELLSSPDQEAIVDESELTRDRKYFTKVILKTFIKYSVHRESWAGAPWLVKDEYAKMHRIDQTIPIHLLRHKGLPSPEDLKQMRLEKRERVRQEKIRAKQERAVETKRLKQEARLLKHEQIDGQKGKPRQKDLKSEFGQSSNIDAQSLEFGPESSRKILQTIFPSRNQNDNSDDFELMTPTRENPSAMTSGSSTPILLEGSPVPNSSTIASLTSRTDRYPTQEDLTIPLDIARAALKPELKLEKKLGSTSLVSLALETWLFLNMYSDPLVLDTFTFDDYLDVLQYDDPSTECPLLNEIFCSLLCNFVGTESTELLVQFPDPPEDPVTDYEDDDEESNADDGHESDHSQDENSNQNQPNDTSNDSSTSQQNGKATKPENDDSGLLNGSGESSSKRNVDGAQDYDESDEEIAPVEESKGDMVGQETNRADSYVKFKSTKWEERLRRRMFKDGGWQIILIGLLHSVLYVPEWESHINAILDVMAPLDKPATLQTALSSFMTLSVELRLKAIQILCEILHSSNLVRNFIDQCLEESTRIRRERLDNLREYKALLETLKSLEEKKRPYFPNGFPKAAIHSTNGTNSNTAVGTPVADSDEESDDEQKYQLFSVGGKRPASSVTRQRKKRKNDAEMALAKENAEFRKLFQQGQSTLAKIEELLDANREVELELVKLDTQRAKMLGKDRYHNRYWWLEGNGIRRSDDETKKDPKRSEDKRHKLKKHTFQSDSDSKTVSDVSVKDKEKPDDDENDSDSDLGYLMGRIWVQGPTDEEAQGYLKKLPESKLPKITTDSSGQLVIEEDSSKSPAAVRVLVDNHGVPASDVSIPERKAIEERTLVLENYCVWGYYDDPDDIQSLVKWLNPYGTREFKLAKEIMSLKPEIMESMRARKEDLTNDSIEQENELKEVLEDDEDIKEIETKMTTVEELLKAIEDGNLTEKQLADIDSVFPNLQAPLVANSDSSNNSRRKSSRLAAASTGTTPDSRQTSSSPSVTSPGKRRSTRGARRATVVSEDEKSDGDDENDASSGLDAPEHTSDEILVQPLQPESLQEKKVRLQQMLEDLKTEKTTTIAGYKQELTQGRVLGWENAKAKEKLGHTLYESQKKRGPTGRGGSSKKK